jgi:phosphatidylinositol-3-phosphatase
VSFVIPSLENDMHDGSVRDGDTWFKVHLSAYAKWAKTHNSLLIVTFDEDNYTAKNHIPTIIHGAHVRLGKYAERISHYSPTARRRSRDDPAHSRYLGLHRGNRTFSVQTGQF